MLLDGPDLKPGPWSWSNGLLSPEAIPPGLTLRALWPMWEGGSGPRDVVRGLNYVSLGSAAPTFGVTAEGMTLNGFSASIDSYVELPYRAIHGLLDLTFLVQFRLTVVQTAARYLFTAASTVSDNMMLIGVAGSSTNRVAAIFDGESHDSFAWPAGQVDVDDGEWHTFVVVRDTVANVIRYCIDGFLVGDRSYASNNALVVDPGGLFLGQEQDSVGGGFDATQAWVGDLGVIAVFEGAASRVQIAEMSLRPYDLLRMDLSRFMQVGAAAAPGIQTLTPDAVFIPATIPSPSISGSGSAVLLPDSVLIPTSVPNPSIAGSGSAILLPDVVVMPSIVPNPSISGSGSAVLLPDAVLIPTVVPNPAISGGAPTGQTVGTGLLSGLKLQRPRLVA